jgi:hypothetical protein
MNLNKLTVKELREVGKRMELVSPLYKMKKDELVKLISGMIEEYHSEALRMDEEMFSLKEDEFMFAGVLWSGKIAKMLRFNDTAIKRYNPTAKRGKDGVVILTAKQKRRINKKARHFGKTIGFWEVSA